MGCFLLAVAVRYVEGMIQFAFSGKVSRPRITLSVMRILIPSDNRNFVEHWVTAFTRAGCEIVTGTYNYYLTAALYDLVIYVFPEELCGWKPPTQETLQKIVEKFEWWEKRCPTIVTVNDVYPPGYQGNSAYRQLFDFFYNRCSWLLHYSQASKNFICQEFPGAGHDRHIVTDLYNYVGLLSKQKCRGPCRAQLGFTGDDFVILIIGLLRFWEEINLVRMAFSYCRVRQKKLLMAGRFENEGSRLRRYWRHMRWRFWLWRCGAAVHDAYIPDEDLYQYLDTADVVVVPRITEMSSGIPSLAMTFGTPVIAPRHGAFPEYLSGTGNLLYESGNPMSLARTMDVAARLDRKEICERNRQRAREWSWDKIVDDCVKATRSS
jgi:glycosyltransferase involved in cell wall biosynthesis